jgi:exocyst complex protein 7
LDVLECFNNKLKPEFKKVLEDTVHASDVMKLSQTFHKNIVKSLVQYIDEIKTNQIEVFPDGAVHQATTNAIGFLKKLLDYASIEDILSEIYKKKIVDNTMSVVQRYAYELLQSVEHNIAAKTREYKNSDLACVFVLNNHYYIYSKLQQEPKFQKLIAKQQIEKYKSLYERDAEKYIQTTWSKVFTNFIDSENKIVPKKGKYGRKARRELKKRLSNFNTMFLDIYHTQRSYSLFNLELKEMVRKMTVDAVLPKYTEFVKKYCSIPFTKRHLSYYLSFEESSLQDMMLRFFDEEREDNQSETSRNNTTNNTNI